MKTKDKIVKICNVPKSYNQIEEALKEDYNSIDENKRFLSNSNAENKGIIGKSSILQHIKNNEADFKIASIKKSDESVKLVRNLVDNSNKNDNLDNEKLNNKFWRWNENSKKMYLSSPQSERLFKNLLRFSEGKQEELINQILEKYRLMEITCSYVLLNNELLIKQSLKKNHKSINKENSIKIIEKIIEKNKVIKNHVKINVELKVNFDRFGFDEETKERFKSDFGKFLKDYIELSQEMKLALYADYKGLLEKEKKKELTQNDLNSTLLDIYEKMFDLFVKVTIKYRINV